MSRWRICEYWQTAAKIRIFFYFFWFPWRLGTTYGVGVSVWRATGNESEPRRSACAGG